MILLLIKLLVELYFEVFKMVVIRREFYGLRDFYRWDLDLFKILYINYVFDECVVCRLIDKVGFSFIMIV